LWAASTYPDYTAPSSTAPGGTGVHSDISTHLEPPSPQLSLEEKVNADPEVQQLVSALRQRSTEADQGITRLFERYQADLKKAEEVRIALATQSEHERAGYQSEIQGLKGTIQQVMEEKSSGEEQMEEARRHIISLKEQLESGIKSRTALTTQMTELSTRHAELERQVARYSASSELNEPVQTPQGVFFSGDYLKKHPEIAAQLTGTVCGEFDPTTSRFTPAPTEGVSQSPLHV
jgi:predicted Ser/Thr protein kinase